MFWDKAAGLYDLFEEYYNGKVNRQLCGEVAKLIDTTDVVLECACGTGMISRHIGKKCKRLIATDFSIGMLKQAKKKCADLLNVKIRRADIMHIQCKNERFDKVVAGNVIHLLDDPEGALKELMRVCKTGGRVIIPTYVNHENAGKPSAFVRFLERFGAGFKCQFDYQSYQEFFKKAGYTDIEFQLITGKMPCAIAILEKK